MGTDETKECGCGCAYSARAWLALPYVGDWVVPADEDEPELVLELRNCPCGSTLAVEKVG